MKHALLVPALAMVLWITPIASGITGGEPCPSPFRPVAEHDSHIELSFPGHAYAMFRELHEGQSPFRLTDFAVPGGRRVDLQLSPFRVMPKGATYLVVEEGGVEREEAPGVVLFRGFVAGPDGGDAFLAVSDTLVNGWLHVENTRYMVSRGHGKSLGPVMVGDFDSPALSLAEGFECRELGAPTVSVNTTDDDGGDGEAGAVPEIRTADWFVECEREYNNLFNTTQEAADYALTLFGASSEIFRRDTGSTHFIPSNYLRVWTTPAPWGDVDGHGDWFAFQAWWASPSNPNQNIPRTAVHLLASPDFGGIAWVDGLCDFANGYAISGVLGSFPYPIQHTSPNNWDLHVVSHECGHIFGSGHKVDYKPPIPCDDGSGPDQATLMDSRNCGPVSAYGMRFHQRVQQQIMSVMAKAPCMQVTPLTMGDYDGDGHVDPKDLAALDRVYTQGFASDGCIDVFDMDGNGNLTRCDRAMLNATINNAPIGLDVFPMVARINDIVDLRACGGPPGMPAALYLANDEGVPTVLLKVGTFNGKGRLSMSSRIITLNAARLRFVAYGLDPSGAILTTPVVDLDLN